ncbi:hypothetical protein [Microbacterium sp.]|uniref:hypothetical protein n=1 Tax=Microbacterium sp. TaxID=51671 RepID=UPI0028128229|nr:hypothetical protein [Microbacterium sp.]
MTDPQLPPPMAPAPVPPTPQGPVPTFPQQGLFPPQAPPPGAYQVPVGGYAFPDGAYRVQVTEPRPPLVGILALILALAAAVLTPVVGGLTAYEIGRRIPAALTYVSDVDSLGFLSPARDQVLWAEVSFWVGTLLGVAAIILGIVAIRQRQGRGQGIAALVVAVIAPMIFFVVLGIALSAGAATGFAGSTV